MQMPAVAVWLLVLGASVAATAAPSAPRPRLPMHHARRSPQDLAITGNFLPDGDVRFVSRDDLLTLPQTEALVSDDENFDTPEFAQIAHGRGIRISGVALDTLAVALGVPARAEMIAAMCDDHYEAHYPASYRKAHRPILVLRIDGRTAEQWPRPHGQSYGPFLISHAHFTTARDAKSPTEQVQAPYGVVMLSFVEEATFDRAMLPGGLPAAGSAPLQGMLVARQNCLRCHDNAAFGGHKAYRSWGELGRLAASHPDYFSAYVRNPRSRNAYSQMPANPDLDNATLSNLVAYFQTFYHR